eukprot:7586600-Pyramimonas_sp.AAC.1
MRLAPGDLPNLPLLHCHPRDLLGAPRGGRREVAVGAARAPPPGEGSRGPTGAPRGGDGGPTGPSLQAPRALMSLCARCQSRSRTWKGNR